MEKFIFRCKTCEIALSVPLVELRDKTKLCTEIEKDYIERGLYVVADQSFSGSIGHWVINLEDAVNTFHHSDTRRTIGCCGLNGVNGRNTVCAQDHEVGTEHSDCWNIHGLEFDPECVEIVRVECQEKA